MSNYRRVYQNKSNSLEWPSGYHQVSLVDSSPSTEMALKLSETASDKNCCISSGESLASVIKKHSMVAILGSIIPAPLAMPTSRAPLANSLAANLGYRSVVMMPLAASNAGELDKSSSAGRAATISSTGKRQPMTPVELGNTQLPLGNLSTHPHRVNAEGKTYMSWRQAHIRCSKDFKSMDWFKEQNTWEKTDFILWMEEIPQLANGLSWFIPL